MLILYNPPSSANKKPILPMSLLALGTVLEGKHNYRIIDGNLEDDPLAVMDRTIQQTGADILGITVMPGPQLIHSVPFCKEIRARHPDLKIIWGGYFPTQHYDACLTSEFVDYVVLGCGEYAFEKLVDALRTGGNLDDVPSLAYKKNGEVQVNAMDELPHPDKLPDYPDYRIATERYLRPTFMGDRTLSHHSSYGCPFKCDFCAVTSMTRGRWLAQSSERLALVVERYVGEFNADAIEFFDNSFFIDEQRVAEFADRIKPLDIGWWGEARIDSLARYDDRTWELMRDSGLKMVFMGAESGLDETLKRMNKGGKATTANTLLIAEKTRKYGIVPELSFVLGNPPDPEADVKATLSFVRKVKKINPHAEIILYMYTPVPSEGELYDEAQKEGFRFPKTLEEWVSPEWRDFSQRRELAVPWLRRSLRRKVRDFECVLNAYYPTITNQRMQGFWKWFLKAASALRYSLGIYAYPLELRVIQKLIAYQRPETSGL